MKRNSKISEKWFIFSSLHMKENPLILKIEKYFNFFKMDKKNVQIKKAWIFYEKTVERDDKKNLA